MELEVNNIEFIDCDKASQILYQYVGEFQKWLNIHLTAVQSL